MPLKVGTAYLDIQAKLDSLRTQLRGQVQQQVKGAGTEAAKGFSNSFKQGMAKFKSGGIAGIGDIFGKAAIGAAGIGAVIAGIKNAADATADFAAEIDDLQDVTGASAEDASRLKAVFDAVGLSAGSAGKPILRLSETLRDGGKGLKEFFTAAEISKLQGQDLSKTIFALADRYKQLNTVQEQNGLLVEAFGARGLGMREVLERSKEDLESYIETAERSGRIFDEGAIESARRYQVAVSELGSTFDGLKMQVGKAAIPLLTNFTSNLNELVLDTEDAGHKVSGAMERLPGPVQKAFGFLKNEILGGIPGVGVWIKDAEVAEGATEGLTGSLDELRVSALDNEEAAERLGAVYKNALEIASQAAADFEKRLDSLSPSIGEPFKDIEFGIADRFDIDADAIESAQERVEDAQDRLSDTWNKFASGGGFDKGKWQPSEGVFTLEELRKSQEQFAKAELEREADFMSEHAGDLDDAAKDYKRAVGDLADAKEDLEKAQKGTLIEGFSTVLTENTADLELFADSLEKLKTRFQKLGSEGVGQFEEAFLAGLADLGPGAAGLLKNVANLSDKELSSLKDKFAAQVKAAKKAADIEFDKYPANFAEKMGAARDAAIGKGQEMVERFNMLEGNLTLQEAMADEVTGVAQIMEATLGPTLNDQQIAFLEVARTAGTAAERIGGLQSFINSLTSKTVDIQANVNIVTTQDPNAKGLMLLPEFLAPGNGPGSDAYARRAVGGPVRAGYPYWVGEEGRELFVPETNGRVASHSQSMAASGGGATTIVVPVSIDGREVARVTAPYNSREADRRRRARV